MQRLDGDKNVDVIVLLEYDSTLLTIPNLLETKNKKIIKLGARELVNKRLSTRTCNTNGLRNSKGSEPQDTYCLTDLNITNKNR